MTDRQQTILACPLDWGLGHASRMIPVIHHLNQSGYKVILGGTGKSLDLLKDEFPLLQQILLPSLTIRYSRGNFQAFYLFLQIPWMMATIRKERKFIKKLLADHKIDGIVSDNRYGLFCKGIHTVLITHQISPVLPCLLRWLEYPLYILIRTLICRFDECWIPDFPDHASNLTCILSHRFRLPSNARYVGILSRFNNKMPVNQSFPDSIFEMVVVLSGPEPQKSILLDLILQQIHLVSYKTLVVCGLTKPAQQSFPQYDQISYASNLPTDRFYYVLRNANVIICRSGYSSIMDLVAVKKPAILIPTPGQTEQEYLAKHISSKGFFVVCKQKNFSLKQAIIVLESKSQESFPFDLKHMTSLSSQIPEMLYQKNKQHTSKAQ